MEKKKGFTVSDTRKIDRKILDEPVDKAVDKDQVVAAKEPQQNVTMVNYFALPAAPMNHPGMIMQMWASTLITMRQEMAKADQQRALKSKSIGVSDQG